AAPATGFESLLSRPDAPRRARTIRKRGRPDASVWAAGSAASKVAPRRSGERATGAADGGHDRVRSAAARGASPDLVEPVGDRGAREVHLALSHGLDLVEPGVPLV